MKILFVLVMMIVLGGCATKSMVEQNKNIAIEQKEDEAILEENDSFCNDYRYDLKEVKIGQKYGEFAVKKIVPISSQFEMDWGNAQIDFEGEVTLEGEYVILPEGRAAMGGNTGFDLLSYQSEAKMPIFQECEKAHFIFTNETKARELLGVGRGRAVIVIKNYSLRNLPTELLDQVEIVSVIDKVKYPDSWNYWEKTND